LGHPVQQSAANFVIIQNCHVSKNVPRI